VHLDAPECEQADVLRGLRTYANASPANARQLAELIAKLPAEKQPLGKELLRKVQHGGE
jgi:hypothetical protein